jgi:hypothetical protein
VEYRIAAQGGDSPDLKESNDVLLLQGFLRTMRPCF